MDNYRWSGFGCHQSTSVDLNPAALYLSKNLKFLSDHPGGEKAILSYAGRDATEEFNLIHRPKVIVIPRYAADAVIGKVKA